MNTENKKPIIDLSKYGGPVFSGRKEGERVRERININGFEAGDETVDVLVPDNTYAFNSSFFLGLFGDSVRKCGSVEEFLAKFSFKAPDAVMRDIRQHAGRALRETGPLV